MNERITVARGDITVQEVQAIVNAANSSLLGGGGVDGAIHLAAGPGLLEECRGLGGCPTGEARITGGHNLAADRVIHTVGPVWHGGGQGEEAALARCYGSVFALMEQKGIGSVAFPAISTGVYRFPISRAAAIAVRETRAFLARNEMVEEVRFICFDEGNFNAYRTELGLG